jgi:hypothetical protein
MPKLISVALIRVAFRFILENCPVRAQATRHPRIASLRLIPRSLSPTRDTHLILHLKPGKTPVNGISSDLGRRLIYSPCSKIGSIALTSKLQPTILVDRKHNKHIGFALTVKNKTAQLPYVSLVKEAVPMLHKWIIKHSNSWKPQDAQDVRDILAELGTQSSRHHLGCRPV